MRRALVILLIVLGLGAGAWWWGRTPLSDRAQAADPPARTDAAARAIAIRSAAVTVEEVPIQVEAIGRVRPLAEVTLRSRIDSQVEQVHFTEGQEVKAGDLLFTLDDRPAAAALRQAEANLARDQARLELAKADVARYSDLLKRNVASKQQAETANANAAALEAEIAAGQAMVDQARLTVSFTEIRAPIDGRTGELLVDPGNLVQGNSSSGTGLVTVTQLRPINVTFTLPERYLTAIRESLARSGQPPEVIARTGSDREAVEGKLSFIDSQVDTTTGTIALKGEFANADTALWPGQFTNVTLVLGRDPEALTVPDIAVQAGQDGSFVFRIKDDQTVEMVPVTVSRSYQGRSVIASGLAAGDRVVTDGQLRLVPGARVADRDAQGGEPPAGRRPADPATPAPTAQVGAAS